MQLTRGQRAGINLTGHNADYIKRTGQTRSGAKIWEPWEIDLLRTRYPDYARLEALLPHRTRKAVIAKAFALGVTRKRHFWSRHHQLSLGRRYPSDEAVTAISEDLGRVPRQVWGRAHRQRLRRPAVPPKPVEDETIHSIRQRCFELRISLTGCDEDLGARGAIRSGRRTKRLPDIAFRAAAMLGGKIVVVE